MLNLFRNLVIGFTEKKVFTEKMRKAVLVEAPVECSKLIGKEVNVCCVKKVLHISDEDYKIITSCGKEKKEDKKVIFSTKNSNFVFNIL